jgi:hypothetical protein
MLNPGDVWLPPYYISTLPITAVRTTLEVLTTTTTTTTTSFVEDLFFLSSKQGVFLLFLVQ